MRAEWRLGDVAPLLRLAEAAPDDAAPAEPSGTYRLSERQAQAILDLRLHRLTQLERSKITDELNELGATIRGLLHVLRSRARLLEVLKEELVAVKERFATPRRTTIEEGEDYDIDIEDLIQQEDMVVTVTRLGYIKRTPLSTYRARPAAAKAGRHGDPRRRLPRPAVRRQHPHAGAVLQLRGQGLQAQGTVCRSAAAGARQGDGQPVQPPRCGRDRSPRVLPLPEDESTYTDLSVVFATSSGKIRRNALADFIFVPANGKIAMKLDEGDHLVGVEVATERHDVLLAARGGKCVRFPVGAVRVLAAPRMACAAWIWPRMIA